MYLIFQLVDISSKASHGFGAHDDIISHNIHSNNQPHTGVNFHSYSSPPPASVASAPNGPVTVVGSVFPSSSSAASGGGVAYYRDTIGHVQSTPGSAAGASSLPQQPAHRLILTAANPASANVPITAGRAVIVSGSSSSSVPCHSSEPSVKRLCVE